MRIQGGKIASIKILWNHWPGQMWECMKSLAWKYFDANVVIWCTDGLAAPTKQHLVGSQKQEHPEATQWDELAVLLEGKDCRIGCGVKGGRGFKGNIMARTSGDTCCHCLRCCHNDDLREKKTRTIK